MEDTLQTEIIAQWEELFASLLKQGRIKGITKPEKIMDPETCPMELQSMNNFLRRQQGIHPDDAPYSSEYDSSETSEETVALPSKAVELFHPRTDERRFEILLQDATCYFGGRERAFFAALLEELEPGNAHAQHFVSELKQPREKHPYIDAETRKELKAYWDKHSNTMKKRAQIPDHLCPYIDDIGELSEHLKSVLRGNNELHLWDLQADPRDPRIHVDGTCTEQDFLNYMSSHFVDFEKDLFEFKHHDAPPKIVRIDEKG